MIIVKIKDDTPELMQKVQAAISRFVRKGAAYIKGQLKVSMAEPKTGRQYGKHRASAPGESPAVDSSNLTGLITMLFPSTLEAKVGTPVEYARYLEDGTGRMKPRPLWAKTVEESLPTLEQLLAAEIRRV